MGGGGGGGGCQKGDAWLKEGGGGKGGRQTQKSSALATCDCFAKSPADAQASNFILPLILYYVQQKVISKGQVLSLLSLSLFSPLLVKVKLLM